MSGEPLSFPPYGYTKDPANPKHWIVDEEAARVVRRIFSMTLDGMGTDQIASTLEREHVLAPAAYWVSKDINRPGKPKEDVIPHWAPGTIIKILARQEYCGDVINFKTYSKSKDSLDSQASCAWRFPANSECGLDGSQPRAWPIRFAAVSVPCGKR